MELLKLPIKMNKKISTAPAALSTQREVKVVKPCHSELHAEEWEGNRALLFTKLVTTFFFVSTAVTNVNISSTNHGCAN